MMSQKNRNTKFYEKEQNIFGKKFFDQKSPKTSDFGHFFRKNGKNKNFWSKKIFWSDSIQNGQKRILNENLDFEKNFSSWLDIAIFRKMVSQVEKMSMTKIVDQKNFLSESIQYGPKRNLKPKSRFRKKFPIMTWNSHFSKNGVAIRKNGKDKNFWPKFFCRNRFRMVQNVI